MRGKGDDSGLRDDARVNTALTERGLRKRGVLDADEQIVEWKTGRILRWTLCGEQGPVPGSGERFGPRQVRGWCGCCYSDRKLFFGSKASLYGDLAFVWHVDSADEVLRVVIATEPQPVAVWWRSGENEDAGGVADFADRIRTQRGVRLAELPSDIRRGMENRIARLAGSELLAGLLAEPVSPA